MQTNLSEEDAITIAVKSIAMGLVVPSDINTMLSPNVQKALCELKAIPHERPESHTIILGESSVS